MVERIYIETTFVSYLTARPNRDIVIAGHQQITREWWETRRADFQLCISRLVMEEAMAGDPQAALARSRVLQAMTLLDTTKEALTLAKELIGERALPAKSGADALHIAIAASQEVPYLMTWNCRHLANVIMRARIESVCDQNGFKAPMICTPEELFEVRP